MNKSIIALLVAGLLTACGHENDAKTIQPQAVAPQYQQQAPVAAAPAQPIVVQQSAPAQSGASTGDMLMAGAAGYMLNNMLNGGSRNAAPAPAPQAAPTTVVNKTYVTKNYVQEAPKPAAPVAPPAPAKPAVPSYTAPAPKPTTSYSASKPMSYSSSSSFSSSSRSFSSGRR